MTPKEFEPEALEDVPSISKKTPNNQLKEWSKKRWESDGRRRIAADIILNGQELLAESNVDWEFVLKNIRVQQVNNVQCGEDAIAMRDAQIIGALAVAAGWSMDNPAIVYLSGQSLANSAGSKLENFKSTMREAAVMYGQKVFPNPNLYMEILDFLLELRGKNQNIKERVASLLGKGSIKEAYDKMVKYRDDLVRKRG